MKVPVVILALAFAFAATTLAIPQTVSRAELENDLDSLRQDLQELSAQKGMEHHAGENTDDLEVALGLGAQAKNGEWPPELQKWVSTGGDTYKPAGQLNRAAYQNEDARKAIIKLATKGLVPCPSLPKSGEELAAQIVANADWLAGASCDSKASPQNQAKMVWVTEGMTDFQSTCGYVPNLLLALAGVRPSMCGKWRMAGKPWASKLSNVPGKCDEPFFNRKYNIKDVGGQAVGTNFWQEAVANDGITGGWEGPKNQHNFGALMAMPTYTKFPRVAYMGKPDKAKHIPKPGDLYFIQNPSKGEAGHVGVIRAVKDENPSGSATDQKEWKYTFTTIDGGQTCGYKPPSWRSVSQSKRGFSYQGWQCVTSGTKYNTRRFKYGKVGTSYGFMNYWNGIGIDRFWTGFVKVRDLVDDTESGLPIEQRFDPAYRFCTPQFAAKLKAGHKFSAGDTSSDEHSIPNPPDADGDDPGDTNEGPTGPSAGGNSGGGITRGTATVLIDRRAPAPFSANLRQHWASVSCELSSFLTIGKVKLNKDMYNGVSGNPDRFFIRKAFNAPMTFHLTCTVPWVGVTARGSFTISPGDNWAKKIVTLVGGKTHEKIGLDIKFFPESGSSDSSKSTNDWTKPVTQETSSDPCGCRKEPKGLYRGSCGDWDKSGYSWCYVNDTGKCTQGKVGVWGVRYRRC